MPRSCLSRSVLVLIAALAAAGAHAATATKPSATGPAPAQKAASPRTATATQEARQKESEEAVPKALIEAAKGSFVVVKLWYKKDLSEPAALLQDNWQVRRIYEEYIENKYPEELTGIVLDAAGHVLIYDDRLEDRFLDKVEVEDVAGEVFLARREKLLFDTSAILLKVDAEAAGKLRPLKFVPVQDEGVDTKLFQAVMYKADDQWRIRFAPLRPAVRYAPGEPGNVFYGYRMASGYLERFRSFGYGGLATILADEDGRPVGCSMETFLDLRQTECVWKGLDLPKAEGISWADLRQSEQAVRDKLTAAVHEVVIAFHQGGGEEGAGPSALAGSPRLEAAAGREITGYGVAISDTEIFMPVFLDRKVAARIDKIFVKFSPWDRRPADFVGAFKDFGGFVIRLRKGKLPAQVELAAEELPQMKPFWVARARKKLGQKYVDLVWDRIRGKTRGYAGKYHWYVNGPVHGGAMLVDFSGRLAGMYLHERVEHEEERELERSGMPYGPSRKYRIFTISEIRDELTKPLAHLDPKIEVKTRTESKRRSWIGVEYVLVNPDLAEELKVETPTKDGQLGFMVSAVYPGGPAEKLGIKVGDILLRIQAPKRPYPIELNRELGGESGRFDREFGRSWRMRGVGMEAPQASWRDRANALTRALDAIGIGEKVAITYYRPAEAGKGQTVTSLYTIEQAPPDFESAPKWRNRKLGLTVKDLTYEIRFALRLKPSDPGVIVAQVEDGSPMDTARIYANEVLTRLDGEPLASARQMRDLVAAARKAGKEKVRLTIFRLGKTRFADLTVKAYDPSDDEGLEGQQP